MAYEKEKVKAGMEGRTSRTERWGGRDIVKSSAKKLRRFQDKSVIKEQIADKGV